VRPAEPPDPRHGGAARRERLVPVLLDLRHRLAGEGEEETLLAAEVVVERRGLHPGGVDDVTDRGRHVPLDRELRGRRREQTLAARGTASGRFVRRAAGRSRRGGEIQHLCNVRYMQSPCQPTR